MLEGFYESVGASYLSAEQEATVGSFIRDQGVPATIPVVLVLVTVIALAIGSGDAGAGMRIVPQQPARPIRTDQAPTVLTGGRSALNGACTVPAVAGGDAIVIASGPG